jgi:chaperone modulatory protein CbpM
MKLPLRRPLVEVSEICNIPSEEIIHFIEEKWINPIDIELNMLDDEDVCRILLIQDLKVKLGVNDEAVPVILHLVDQLNLIIHVSNGETL